MEDVCVCVIVFLSVSIVFFFCSLLLGRPVRNPDDLDPGLDRGSDQREVRQEGDAANQHRLPGAVERAYRADHQGAVQGGANQV